jgi:hypothetical protein
MARLNYLPVAFICKLIDSLASEVDPRKRNKFVLKLTLFIDEIPLARDGIPKLYSNDLKLLETLICIADDQLKLSKGEEVAFLKLIFVISKKIPHAHEALSSSLASIIFYELRSYDLGFRGNDVDMRFRFIIMSLMFILQWPHSISMAGSNLKRDIIHYMKELVVDNDSKTSCCAAAILTFLIGKEEMYSEFLRQNSWIFDQVARDLLATVSASSQIHKHSQKLTNYYSHN